MTREDEQPDEWHLHVNAADDLEVCDRKGRVVCHWSYSVEVRERKDPNLIAAAPKLLALVKRYARSSEVVAAMDIDAEKLLAQIEGP